MGGRVGWGREGGWVGAGGSSEADLSAAALAGRLTPADYLLLGASVHAVTLERAGPGATFADALNRVPTVFVQDWVRARGTNAYNGLRPVTWILERGGKGKVGFEP